MKVALLDSNHVALTVARSLSKKGIIVDLLRINRSVADYSLCIHEIVDFQGFTSNVDGTYSKLKQHLKKNDYDLVIPITDAANEICQNYYCDLLSVSKIAMASPSSLQLLTNKGKLLDLCAKLEIPFPNSYVVRCSQDLQFLERMELKFPLYLKPEKSVKIINNRILTFNVSKVYTLKEMIEFCMLNQLSVPVIIQENVNGPGVGVYLIAQFGEVLTMVAQRRLHEPIGGGPGSFRESFLVPEPLSYWTKKLVRETDYTGIAMFEFKGFDQNWHIMEVNGRFWGSLPLTVNSGLDLPYWLTLMHTQSEQFSHLVFPNVPKPRFQRNLKRDLGWLVLSLIKSPSRWSVALNWIRGLRNFFKGTEQIDFFSVRDPIPFLYDWFALLMRFWRRIELCKLSAFCIYAMQRRARMMKVKRIFAMGNANVLIVCFGNICRSPFAEGFLKQKKGYERVKSAGTFPQENRLTPLEIQEMAREHYEVDLAGHRSRCINDELIKWADVIFVMDYQNLCQLKSYNIIKPMILLSEFGNGKNIVDPYHKPKSTIKTVLDQIANLSEEVGHQFLRL
ncbi:MAG: ATP-grasp domain-containing protein [Nitrospira sp.]|nr:ATP-grasp domain-containing protein [Nitrospira sp.]